LTLSKFFKIWSSQHQSKFGRSSPYLIKFTPTKISPRRRRPKFGRIDPNQKLSKFSLVIPNRNLVELTPIEIRSSRTQPKFGWFFLSRPWAKVAKFDGVRLGRNCTKFNWVGSVIISTKFGLVNLDQIWPSRPWSNSTEFIPSEIWSNSVESTELKFDRI